MVPTRANTSMKVAASAGRNEMSIFMRVFDPYLPPGRAGEEEAPPAAMRAASRITWPCKRSAMNGSASSMAMKIARIFGTKTSVISWICVSAWNSEITTPTMSPINISGLATSTSVMIASRATSSTSGPVMTPPASPACPSSDRHLHDVFVGRDDAVAHGNERIDRDLGLRPRRHHVDNVGLAGGHGMLLGIRLVPGFDHGAERVLEQRAKARAVAIVAVCRLGETCGRIGHAREACIGIRRGGGRRHVLSPSCPRSRLEDFERALDHAAGRADDIDVGFVGALGLAHIGHFDERVDVRI